jgi:hypothetical protein
VVNFGAVSAEYSAVISSALNTLFQILSRERPPSKKLLKSRVPSRNGADPAIGSISNCRLSFGGGWKWIGQEPTRGPR